MATRPWTVAPCLVKLRAQVDRLAPNRSKRSDGTIGDAAHAATVSDHNPDAAGIVRAFDITHDPAHGLDCGALAAAIVASRDPRVKYLIWNRRVIGSKHWTWTPYDGGDPHTSHLHVSVVPDGRANGTADWRMPNTHPAPPPTAPKEWSDVASKEEIKAALREVLAEEDTARELFTGHRIVRDVRAADPDKAPRVAPSTLLEEAAKRTGAGA